MSNRTKGSILWTIQGLLAVLFLFAGSVKLVLPIEALRGPVPLPGAFLRGVGVLEVAGALGLILPALLHIKRALTPFAAVGLVAIMAGATVVTLEGGMTVPALLPLVVGLLSASVAYGRRAWTPLH